MSEIINLNYKWYFKENYNKDDLQLGNFKDFKEVDLPHSNKIVPINNFDEKMIQIVSIYKKMINIESLDDQYVLRFEGIGQKSKVYVNGKYVASHLCGFTRFDVDITSFLHVQENEIAVVVDSREINQPPFGFVIDYLCFGGIYREAYLLKRKKVHFIDSYFHHDENNWFFDYKISSKSKKYRINLSIKDEKDNEIFSSSCNNLSEIKGKMKKVHLWDVDDPYLHTLKANIVDENNIEIDSISYQVGFRFLSLTPSGVLLNHKHIKVMGVNRHQSYPQVGYAMAKRGQYDDAIKIKELGFNAVRTSHYPQSIHFLDACDKLGLLVFEEIPGWQHVGDEKWKKIAINNVKDMIVRDKNHPCIMLWGVRINESIDDHDFYVKTNQMAHECDPYRLTGGVRCIPHSELLEDVYTYNDFVNSGKNLYLKDKKEITSDMSKPYLVSEYGGHMFPTKAFDNENRRGELCLLHGNVVQEARRHDDIIATFAWCFADYNTHKEFGSGDLICYHGICDIFRNDKYSTYAYKKYKNEPYLEVTSNFNIGESNGGYIRDIVISTNCDFVKMYHNNQLIQTFTIDDYQRNGTFKVKDLIGDLLVSKHGLSVDRSKYLKQIIEEVLKYDGIISDKIIAKYGKDDVNEAWNYYGKYVSNWGSKVTPYYFEGYKNNKKVVSLYKGPQYLSHINVTLSTNTLISSDTYDVCKVSLQAIGNLNNRVDYAFNAFKVETSNNLEIMGNKYMALIAGSYSFYVRNIKDEGEAWIKICFDNAKDLLIKLEIRKDENKQYEKISKYCNSSSYVIRMHK